MTKTVVIITAFVTNQFQENVFQKCIESVKAYYPTADIVILSDIDTSNLISVLKNNDISLQRIQFLKTPAQGAGECNAYIWAANNAEMYDIFLFLHDSVILFRQLPELKENTLWNPLWYADSIHSTTGIVRNDVGLIAEKLVINGKNGLRFFEKILRREVDVTFGSMGIWRSEFSVFLRDNTNIREILPLFNTKPLRCLLERILSCIFHELHPEIKPPTFKLYASCGDIFKHSTVGRNISFEPSVANNPYALKIWQYR